MWKFVLVPMITAGPLWWRFQQNLRRSYETSQRRATNPAEGVMGGDVRGQKDRKNDGSISGMGGEGVALRGEIRFC